MSNDTAVPVTAPASTSEEVTAPSSSDAPAATDAEPLSEVVPASEEAAELAPEAAPASQTNGASEAVPQTQKKEKRKSTGGVPEHKSKKLNRKQSKVDLKLNLDVQPGQHWFAIMKGYKPWPAVVCDENMLPETLLSKRPVSALRPDGSYREDFMEGGKNARERRYPIMFLGTNEFAWQVNTDLRPLNLDDVKKAIEEHATKAPAPKALGAAFRVAAENHDLDWYKALLKEHEDHLKEQQQEIADAEREAEESADKGGDADVEMEDAEGAASAKKKKAPKRKAPKEEDVDEEGKPLKTPKKLKIKAPSAATETPAEASATKSKKKAAPKKEKVETKAPKSPAKPVAPEPSAEELYEKMQKTILFLRHKLQKGFLSRDKPPEESEMPAMHEHMKQLENYNDLDGQVIRTTKINKVLKAIIKLATIPREHEFSFKTRAQEILAGWGKQLQDENAAAPATNGVAHDEEKARDDSKPVESIEKSVEPAAAPTEEKKDAEADAENKPEGEAPAVTA